MPRGAARGRNRRHQRHAAAAAGGTRSSNKKVVTAGKNKPYIATVTREIGGKENTKDINTAENATNGVSNGADSTGAANNGTGGDNMMVDEYFDDDDDDDNDDKNEDANKKRKAFEPSSNRGPKRKRPMKFASVLAAAAKPFATLRHPKATVIPHALFTSSASSSTVEHQPHVQQRFQTFQNWLVPRMKSKDWRRTNARFLGEERRIVGECITVFSFANQTGENPIVGAIVLSCRQHQEQHEWNARHHHRGPYYDTTCRAFLELDERTGNVVRQWTNFRAASTNDIVVYRHMLEKLLRYRDTQETVVFSNQASLDRANEAGKLNFRYDYALCLLEEHEPV